MDNSSSPVISIPRRDNLPKPSSPPPGSGSHSKSSRGSQRQSWNEDEDNFTPNERRRREAKGSKRSTPRHGGGGDRSRGDREASSQQGRYPDDVPWSKGDRGPERRGSGKGRRSRRSSQEEDDDGEREGVLRTAWDGPSSMAKESDPDSPVKTPNRRSQHRSRNNSSYDDDYHSPRGGRRSRKMEAMESYEEDNYNDYDDRDKHRDRGYPRSRQGSSAARGGGPSRSKPSTRRNSYEEGYPENDNYEYEDRRRPKPRSRAASSRDDFYDDIGFTDESEGRPRRRNQSRSYHEPPEREHPRSRANSRSQRSSPVCSPRYGEVQDERWARTERSERRSNNRFEGEDDKEYDSRRSHPNSPASRTSREPSASGVFSPMFNDKGRTDSLSQPSRKKKNAYYAGPVDEENEEDLEAGGGPKPMSCRAIDQMMRGVEVLFNPADFPQALGDQATICSVPLGCPGTVARAILHRQEGLAGKINPLFKFTLEGASESSGENGPTLWSKKSSAVGVNVPYLISLERVDLELPRFSRSDGFIGKLSNKGNGKYVIYNAGCNPDYLIESEDESCEEGDDELFGIPTSLIRPRCEYGCLTFNKDVHRPQMEVGLPNVTYDDGASTIFVWQPRAADEQMLANFQVVTEKWGQNQIMTDRLYCLSTEEVHRLVGTKDNKGRVYRESVKNFQIVLHRPSLEEEDYTFEEKQSRLVWLQMHKVGNNTWSVEFIYPMSILQAFGICLARFDHRFK